MEQRRIGKHVRSLVDLLAEPKARVEPMWEHTLAVDLLRLRHHALGVVIAQSDNMGREYGERSTVLAPQRHDSRNYRIFVPVG